jgi:hypothetical protein
MNTPTSETGKSGRKLAMALVLGAAFGSLAATPVFARDDHGGGHRGGGHAGGHGDRGHHGGGGWGVGVYSDPVYVPQPVYYDPQPSPGISIALPLNVHIR